MMKLDERVQLSRRMEAVAAMITPGSVVCDVGTDHGYLPIAMVKRAIAPSAIAMDVREGPLGKARENIKKTGLGDRIGTRLGDGVQMLKPGEADTVVIAGMGGDLVIHILSDGEAICKGLGELILQPQSHIEKVRDFLAKNGYWITDENMIQEDGKYYVVIRATPLSGNEPGMQLAPVECWYGPVLLRRKNPVLQKYLIEREKRLCRVSQQLGKAAETERIRARRERLELERKLCREAGELVRR